MDKYSKPPDPVHVPGVGIGEERVIEHGREDGCGGRGHYCTAGDSTSINPKARAPIHPAVPSVPPA